MRSDDARVVLLAVLSMLGGAIWVSLPIGAADLVPTPLLSVAILSVGALLGAAGAVAASPEVSRPAVILAAPLVVAVVRACGDLLASKPLTVQPSDALLIAGALAAAGLGVLLARALPIRLGRIGAAAFVQLAILILTSAIAVILDLDTLSLVVCLGGAFLGGLIAVRLSPETTTGEVATGWVLFWLTAFATAAISTSAARLMITAIVATVLAPIPTGLAALGAAVGRRRPRPAPLPDAAVVR